METKTDYVVFILTHGRPDNVRTFGTLERAGYTGPLYLVIDDEDQTADRYYEKFGRDKVIMFCKEEVAKTVDQFDNFNDRRAILYARNACFDIAESLGYKWFVELDDDYNAFIFRMNGRFTHPIRTPTIKKEMNSVIKATFDFYKSIPVASIAFSQGGDWFGGKKAFGDPVKRKAMNSFFCCTERRFKFIGRINEDVNAYTWTQSQGPVFFTLPHVQLCQSQTQHSKGGMTGIYLDNGTYVKSFYTILCAPSCVEIDLMGEKNKRMHHKVNWPCAVPLIISDKYRKL